MTGALVLGGFDDLDLADVRLVEEAARFGPVKVLLPSDALVVARTGRAPAFPFEERRYLCASLRHVHSVSEVGVDMTPRTLPEGSAGEGATWVVRERDDAVERRAFAANRGVGYEVIPEAALVAPAGRPGGPRPAGTDGVARGQPDGILGERPRGRTVVVTGCYDWLHSGHIWFFEEASRLGALTVTVGNDASVADFKGEGHPMHGEHERRYMVAAVRFVHQALISTGSGWMDALPEIERLRPDAWVVNEDGDRPEKRAYCEAHAIEYHVLRRLPREGLPSRRSTTLRGF